MLPVNTQNALGIDIGSTTTKIVLVRSGQIVYEKYERHLSRVREKTLELIEEIRPLLEAVPFTVALSGSAGLGVAEAAGIPFVQEVYATGEVVRCLEPDTSAVMRMPLSNVRLPYRSSNGGATTRKRSILLMK